MDRGSRASDSRVSAGRLLVAVLLLASTGIGPGCGKSAAPAPAPSMAEAVADLAAHPRRAVSESAALLIRAAKTPADLLPALKHPQRAVREAAAHALGDLAPQEEAVVHALMARIEDPDDYVRWKAIRALGRIGKPAGVALPVLTRIALAGQETEVVAASAAKAVAEIRAATAR